MSFYQLELRLLCLAFMIIAFGGAGLFVATDLRDQNNAQTVQLNEIIQHIDGLNKSQNDILKYCNMGD